MKKLCSMVDFVLQEMSVFNDCIGEDKYELENYQTLKIKIENYADFLKQPLELWMFVLCDENENVLQHPDIEENRLRNSRDGGWWNEFVEYKNKYQQAKERCLFEGFEFKGETQFSWIFKHNNTYPIMIHKGRELDYLNVILKRDIYLTPTAQKQISC